MGRDGRCEERGLEGKRGAGKRGGARKRGGYGKSSGWEDGKSDVDKKRC